MLTKIASAIYNDVMAGLAGYTSSITMSLEQLEDDVVDERLQIIKEYAMQNAVPRKDLMMSINCIPVDCKSLDKCPCDGPSYSEPVAHFEIPQILNDIPGNAVEYLGTVDKQVPFVVYTSQAYLMHKHKRRGANKPYVYIDTTPNENNLYDGWIFNAPLIQTLSVTALFKNPRQVALYDCCAGDDLENYTSLSNEIKRRLTEKKLRFYRMNLQPAGPNDQKHS